MSDHKTVTLRTVAEKVGLAPCSVSAVLNKTPAARAIPKQTQDRVIRAAAELNYRPNLSARSLRTKRTYLVAVVSNDFAQGHVGQVVAGMERVLRQRGYLLALGAFDCPSEWASLSLQLRQHGMEGVMAIGVSLPRDLALPAVSVHVGSLNHEGTLAADTGAWLRDLGESAAEAMLAKIESNTAPMRTQIVLKPPQSHFPLSGSDLSVPAESAVPLE